jgi:hypothetical protein
MLKRISKIKVVKTTIITIKTKDYTIRRAHTKININKVKDYDILYVKPKRFIWI